MEVAYVKETNWKKKIEIHFKGNELQVSISRLQT